MNDASRLGPIRRIRHRIGLLIDRVARRIGRPVYHVWPPGYVGTVDLSVDELEAELREAGSGWDPFSFYHYTPEGSSTDGSWVYRSSPFADRQLHVVLFAWGSNRVGVYAHEEYNWKRHPIGHARAAGIRRQEGARAVRSLLATRRIEYDRRPKLLRKVERLAERLRERLRGLRFDAALDALAKPAD